MKYKFKLQPGMIIAISIIIGIVMITSAYFELEQSKKEVFHILSDQASSLIETINLSSVNTLNSSQEIENLIADRLFNNARFIRSFDSENRLTQEKLIEFSRENNLYRINIFNSKGEMILSNQPSEIRKGDSRSVINRREQLKPVLSGEADEIVIGLKEAEFSGGQRFAVAVARTAGRGAIVINFDASEFLDFRRKIGIGRIIQDIADNPGIEYVVLQDSIGILAASSSVTSIGAIEGDDFLTAALTNDSTYKRITNFNEREVYEVVKRLDLEGEFIGLYRIGLSLKEIKSVEDRMYRRIIIISLILAAFSIIVLSIVFTSQNLKSLSREFERFKSFTGTILTNMGEAVIVVDKTLKVVLFNKYAEIFFAESASNVINQPLENVSNGKISFIKDKINALEEVSTDFEKEIQLNNMQKFVSINITKNKNEAGQIEHYTIVIKDLTQNKILEEQSKRNEKLSAMGELASGVAHEIRNPINAIGMIAHRLNKEFSPEREKEEYAAITNVLKNEVTRVNKIITQFLSYAKPFEMERRLISSKDFFEEIYRLFIDQAKGKQINLILSSNSDFSLSIDPELFKQALMNIIQNALEATPSQGEVRLDYSLSKDKFIVEVSDSGIGISETNRKKIFDLYYTTKNDGNGLGLSIAQKIINQHNGSIEFSSELNKGTTFTIKLKQQ